ncbi:MAG TPA: NADH-quinone oxidoreductase subunit J [Candidatus Latescibacteria bacterium]|jgi:NADH-quinone oxidoreductase subunit J|nr:NADH-quinone oxidoreductase subunit J [Gemmatimonadaceae bacterium]MDP6016056.1 NADH-quinone oxidoreductase subunit J [Candidatus Latescibacterota bacterium]HJP30529.1 NADH-quinone oxidoreductase subunit J [Candidatus Latescibacterota bacterium]
MIGQAIQFLFVGLVLVGGGVAALSRHVLYNIIGLGISLFGVAGLFLLLGSPFVAAMQLLIYLGGITVAIVFAMMLSIAMTLDPLPRSPVKTGFAAVAALVFGMGVYGLIGRATFAEVAPVPAEAWAVGRIGNALLEHYNLVFETLSVVLLLAIIGAILIARPGQRGKAA